MKLTVWPGVGALGENPNETTGFLLSVTLLSSKSTLRLMALVIPMSNPAERSTVIDKIANRIKQDIRFISISQP